MTRAMLYLVHVASQLMYRWIDPFIGGKDFLSDCVLSSTKDCLYELTSSDWKDLLLDLNFESKMPMHWLDLYLSSKEGTVSRLIRSAMDHLQQCKRNGGHIVLICDKKYPPLLREIPDPPLCLTIRGDQSLLDYRKISVVGSRKACARALTVSRELGEYIAEAQMAVVSGGAYGCDIAAHRGVLATDENPAPAILVFAGGLGRLYPRGNQLIFEQLQEKNAVFLSERLWDCPSLPRDFPVRNRIVSGLSTETIIVQAGHRSGAMTTARLALDQGRDLSVLDFTEDDLASNGNVQLISEGAASFYDVKDWKEKSLMGYDLI
ncbi:MAG: DNA-processing protein DprA [Bdellovibrionota bacterium]